MIEGSRKQRAAMTQDETTYDGPRTSRRTLLGYLVAAPTLSVAVSLGLEQRAAAKVITPPGVADIMDLSDAQLLAVAPTANLISLDLREDGTVHFALPRMEVGQGITTSTAMIIADELDIGLDKIEITLADARPELLMNQLTGGSNTTMTTYLPIRTAAAIARRRLLDAASTMLGGDVPLAALKTVDGKVLAPNGVEISYGELAASASVDETVEVEAQLKEPAEFTVIGTPRNRIDARAAVTGRKQFTMDMDVPGALPTMLCRPPTLNGKVDSVRNRAAVLDMPGVTHVAEIPTGVAVRAETFGQCIDAIRALDVTWGPGPVDGLSDADILERVRRAEIPLAVPRVRCWPRTVETNSTFWVGSRSALEANCAIVNYARGRGTVCSAFGGPLVAKGGICQILLYGWRRGWTTQ
ncbi:isoquinoline 1-oxidoreductase, beta subunit [Nocardioidaceae bacterium Broad-1]|nr:isoquinoline 1-oxidoreductase, beta subunit [Nocardioidaceae bacterium Broad-1]